VPGLLDNYQNLTLKTLHGLTHFVKTSLSYSQPFTHFAKTDDDVFVNVKLMLRTIRKEARARKGDFLLGADQG